MFFCNVDVFLAILNCCLPMQHFLRFQKIEQFCKKFKVIFLSDILIGNHLIKTEGREIGNIDKNAQKSRVGRTTLQKCLKIINNAKIVHKAS